MKKSFWVLCLLIVTVCSAITARTTRSIDRKADNNKARRMVEIAGDMAENNLLAATLLFATSDTLSTNDTTVMLACNNYEIRLNSNMNPLYYPQLDMLEATSNAPMSYYYTMIKAVPPMEDKVDSLAFFETALKAYKRFPREDIFIDNLLKQGAFYLHASRYNETDETVDTLDLSPAQLAFADSLLSYADRIERDNGYSYSVDRCRAAIYTLLDREDELESLTHKLEQRDSTDINSLDLLTSLAYNRGDTTRVFELGLRRFEIDPEGEHVFTLYQAVSNDTLRNKLANAVLAKASDTDIEPETRINILKALAEGYFSNNTDIEEPVEIMDRISDTIEEICAEDPNDPLSYIQGLFLIKAPYWISNYGYRHWINIAENIPEKEGEIQALAATIIPNVENKPRFEKNLLRLRDEDREKHPHLVMDANLALSQYYFNSGLYQQALDLLKPITLQDLKESHRLSVEARKDNNQTDDIDFDDGDDDEELLDRFVLIQTLISECQMKLNQVDNALATLNHVIAIDPENAGALNNLAYYMCENGRDLTIALSLVDRSLEYEPDNFNAIDTRAWILYRKGDVDGALAEMEKLFSTVGIDIAKDLLPTDNEKSAREVIDEKTNHEVVAPLLGHLLIILAEKGNAEPASLWQIADILTDLEPDNADLKEFLAKHKRP